MKADDEARRRELLRVMLTDSSPLLPFAEAVLRHLRGSGAAPVGYDDLVSSALEILRAIHEDDQQLPAKRLARLPALMASFFQNADLLPPSAPETTRLAALVANAMEIVSEGADLS
jgi:hypothetical protein